MMSQDRSLNRESILADLSATILPVDANIHYGFSRFAIELNEILPKERTRLPRTDTRFRPDQRSLEVFFVVDNNIILLAESQYEN